MNNTSSQNMLELLNVIAGYGKVQVLWGVSLSIQSGEIVCLLGPNGAGKTTTLRAITGVLSTVNGEILYNKRRINGLPPYKIARLGISMVPEGRELFPRMSVYENLLIGTEHTNGSGRLNTLKGIYAQFPILEERRRQQARTLSGGEQQMLAIARALMSKPKLLLLDEPSSGLAPKVVAEIFKALEQLRAKGLTLLLVEQNVRMALQISDRGYLLESGRIGLEGSKEDLLMNPQIRSSYLGIPQQS